MDEGSFNHNYLSHQHFDEHWLHFQETECWNARTHMQACEQITPAI